MEIFLPTTNYDKSVTELRGFLKGASQGVGCSDWMVALKAFDFARRYHTGLRKDGRSHEFSHQIFIANYTRTLIPSLIYPAETLATIFCHDLCEDYDVTYETVENMFGKIVRNGVETSTKKYQGVEIPYPVYFARLSEDVCGSVTKGFDRSHNIFTMPDADWPVSKQRKYLEEVTEYYLPMIKRASLNFQEQEMVYQNCKSLLLVQGTHLRRTLEATMKLEALQVDLDETSGPTL